MMMPQLPKELGCLVTLEKDTPVVHLRVKLTDEGIDKLIRYTVPTIRAKNVYWVCAIMDYSEDDRELYEIPEVKDFCKRLVDRGFIAALHPTTLFFKSEKPHLATYLGGIEVYALAEGIMDKNGNLDFTQGMIEEFQVKLKRAERKALALIHPNDGPHRTQT